MDIICEKQKTKIISESGFESLNVDCYIKKCLSSSIIISTALNQQRDFSDFEKGYKLDVKVFTPKGIVIFKSEVIEIISEKEMEITYFSEVTRLEDTRKNPRYKSDCPITIFRPLAGNINTNLIDISIRGIRFYSDISLEVGSVFEIMLYLSDTVGKIIFTGKVLDKDGLPEGVHRMIIEGISYSDRQKLVDYCMSLAE